MSNTRQTLYKLMLSCICPESENIVDDASILAGYALMARSEKVLEFFAKVENHFDVKLKNVDVNPQNILDLEGLGKIIEKRKTTNHITSKRDPKETPIPYKNGNI